MGPYHPDGCKEQADLHAGERRVDGGDDDAAVELGADADADDAKVHAHQGPQPPVHEDMSQVLEVPGPGVVDAAKIVVVNDGVVAGQGLGASGKPLGQRASGPRLAGRQGPVGQPPEQGDTEHDAEHAVDKKHPAEADQAAEAVHLLEAGRHEAHDGGRDLGGGEVHGNALAGAGRRVEQRQVVGHAGPHAGRDDAEEEAQQLDAPGGLGGGEAGADDADGGDDAGHPHAGAQTAHDEVGRKVEEDVGHVEEGEGRRRVAGCEAEDRHEVVLDVLVHGLGDADVGADGRAEEVEDPEGRDDAHVELAGRG